MTALCAAVLLISVAACFSMLRKTYVIKYKEVIAGAAVEYGIDPHLICAVIFCESSFRATAESPAGARGLMQIMPSTGEWLAGKMGIDGFSPEILFEPGINIRMGCRYLRFLLDRYDGSLKTALAAYNAGHGNVDKWLADPGCSSDGELTDIPFPQTAEYVDKVVTVYERYAQLYRNEFSD